MAETGAGQHGVAAATVCARFGLECIVYMGEEDMRRQAPNVVRMGLLGAEVRAVTAGTGTLKEAMNEAIRDWIANVETTHYLIGSAAGPHPYPTLVRELQAPIGREAREQLLLREERLPDAVGRVRRRRLERDRAVPRVPRRRRAPRRRRGRRRRRATQHAASIGGGHVSVLHGSRSYVLCDENGQVVESHSISAGLDYPGVGPEHAYLAETGRARVRAGERRRGARGVPPALPARGHHPGARVEPRAGRRGAPRARARAGRIVLVGLSGRGDKDVDTVVASQ